MKNRIYGERVNIDYDNTLNFFEQRGKDKELKSKYNYVLFQDDSPEIAIMRDKQEKEKICSKLSWNLSEKVLDIGCGIGRWGETILSKGLNYVGIDYSKKLLSIADNNLKEYKEHKKLLHGSFQEFKKALVENDIKYKFDKIFINGVMMYINDLDLANGLKDILSICSDNCEIYLKESMAINERLTLKEFYSDSLTQYYTAIYRSIDEYKHLVQEYFIKNNFKLIEEGNLFEESLKNRKETLDYYFILKRNNL